MQAQNLLEQEENEFLHASVNQMLEVLNRAVGHPCHACLVMNCADALINAYDNIAQCVALSLCIQNGDITQLQVQLDKVQAFSADVEQVCESHLMYNVRHMI